MLCWLESLHLKLLRSKWLMRKSKEVFIAFLSISNFLKMPKIWSLRFLISNQQRDQLCNRFWLIHFWTMELEFLSLCIFQVWQWNQIKLLWNRHLVSKVWNNKLRKWLLRTLKKAKSRKRRKSMLRNGLTIVPSMELVICYLMETQESSLMTIRKSFSILRPITLSISRDSPIRSKTNLDVIIFLLILRI